MDSFKHPMYHYSSSSFREIPFSRKICKKMIKFISKIKIRHVLLLIISIFAVIGVNSIWTLV
jgi:hypothetical protein